MYRIYSRMVALYPFFSVMYFMITAIPIVSLVFKVSHDYRKLWGFLPGCSRVYVYTCMLCKNICLKSWKGPILFDSIIFTGTISPRPNPCSSRRYIPHGCYHIYTFTPPYPPVCQRLFCVSDVSTIYNLFVSDIYIILSYCHRQYQINIPETH